MLGKIKKNLVLEKIPAIVCMTACIASVLMGFALGYIFWGMGEPVLAYGDAAVHQPRFPHIAGMSSELYEPPAQGLGHVASPSALEIDTLNHMYIVTVVDGYIVIYHAEERGGEIKEITGIAVDSLATEERERLMAGIRVYSDEELAWILQDYGS